MGVHVWGRSCDTDAIESIGAKHDIKVFYDATHAFGCSHNGKMIGGFGDCEVFSFHATKFLNSFEGGAIATNNDQLAARMRLMRNFGFSGLDRVVFLGINGKMTEICAAMGITSLHAIDEIIEINRANYHDYARALAGIPGLKLARFDESERNNFQYVVVEVDDGIAPLNRDELIEVLHAENVLARKYFWPGVHRMEPYRSLQPNAHQSLPHSERVAARVIVLPTGQAISKASVTTVASIISGAFARSDEVRSALRERV